MVDFEEAGGRPLPPDSLVTLTHIIYALHAVTVVAGLSSPAFIVTAFLTGWPSILAVILNYLKRDEARGTFLESHFRWQIRTFWFALLWVAVAGLLAISVIGIPMALILALAAGLWVFYRVVRGWVSLLDRKGMPI
jgi:uncharacterized membrane protein